MPVRPFNMTYLLDSTFARTKRGHLKNQKGPPGVKWGQYPSTVLFARSRRSRSRAASDGPRDPRGEVLKTGIDISTGFCRTLINTQICILKAKPEPARNQFRGWPPSNRARAHALKVRRPAR